MNPEKELLNHTENQSDTLQEKRNLLEQRKRIAQALEQWGNNRDDQRGSKRRQQLLKDSGFDDVDPRTGERMSNEELHAQIESEIYDLEADMSEENALEQTSVPIEKLHSGDRVWILTDSGTPMYEEPQIINDISDDKSEIYVGGDNTTYNVTYSSNDGYQFKKVSDKQPTDTPETYTVPNNSEVHNTRTEKTAQGYSITNENNSDVSHNTTTSTESVPNSIDTQQERDISKESIDSITKSLKEWRISAIPDAYIPNSLYSDRVAKNIETDEEKQERLDKLTTYLNEKRQGLQSRVMTELSATGRAIKESAKNYKTFIAGVVTGVVGGKLYENLPTIYNAGTSILRDFQILRPLFMTMGLGPDSSNQIDIESSGMELEDIDTSTGTELPTVEDENLSAIERQIYSNQYGNSINTKSDILAIQKLLMENRQDILLGEVSYFEDNIFLDAYFEVINQNETINSIGSVVFEEGRTMRILQLLDEKGIDVASYIQGNTNGEKLNLSYHARGQVPITITADDRVIALEWNDYTEAEQEKLQSVNDFYENYGYDTLSIKGAPWMYEDQPNNMTVDSQSHDTLSRSDIDSVSRSNTEAKIEYVSREGMGGRNIMYEIDTDTGERIREVAYDENNELVGVSNEFYYRHGEIVNNVQTPEDYHVERLSYEGRPDTFILVNSETGEPEKNVAIVEKSGEENKLVTVSDDFYVHQGEIVQHKMGVSDNLNTHTERYEYPSEVKYYQVVSDTGEVLHSETLKK